jgi:hypothetical protein
LDSAGFAYAVRILPQEDWNIWEGYHAQKAFCDELYRALVCPLLAQSGHTGQRTPQQLSGVERTRQQATVAAANEPKRKSSRRTYSLLRFGLRSLVSYSIIM